MIQYAIFMHSKADISQLNGTENKKQKMKEERLKTKTDVLKKRSGQESVESVLKEEKSLRFEGFVKEVGFKPGVKH